MTQEQFIDKACDLLWDIVAPYVNTSEDCEVIQDAFRKAMTTKTNPLFKQALANVDPETRAEVRGNMDAVVKESLITAGNDAESRFIGKACDAYCQVCGHYPHKVPTHICRQDCDYYMKFRKAMTKKD